MTLRARRAVMMVPLTLLAMIAVWFGSAQVAGSAPAQPCGILFPCDTTTTTEEPPPSTSPSTTPTTQPTTTAPPTTAQPTTTAPPSTEAPSTTAAPDYDDEESDDAETPSTETVASGEDAGPIPTTQNLLMQGDGTGQSAQPADPETQEVGSSSSKEDRLIWMIIAGLGAVAVLVALLTWRYWVMTRPGVDLDVDDEIDDAAPADDHYDRRPARASQPPTAAATQGWAPPAPSPSPAPFGDPQPPASPDPLQGGDYGDPYATAPYSAVGVDPQSPGLDQTAVPGQSAPQPGPVPGGWADPPPMEPRRSRGAAAEAPAGAPPARGGRRRASDAAAQGGERGRQGRPPAGRGRGRGPAAQPGPPEGDGGRPGRRRPGLEEAGGRAAPEQAPRRGGGRRTRQEPPARGGGGADRPRRGLGRRERERNPFWDDIVTDDRGRLGGGSDAPRARRAVRETDVWSRSNRRR